MSLLIPEKRNSNNDSRSTNRLIIHLLVCYHVDAVLNLDCHLQKLAFFQIIIFFRHLRDKKCVQRLSITSSTQNNS
ncbi:unnamed protein product [Rotaria magnacalcarata]